MDFYRDFGDILEFLVGFCGKTEYQAYFEVTFSEYLILEKAYRLKEHREWERVRMLAHNQYLLTPTKGAKVTDPRNWYKLPMDAEIRLAMDKNRKYEVVSKREKEKILQLFNKKDKV